jgi:hypothetical protein
MMVAKLGRDWKWVNNVQFQILNKLNKAEDKEQYHHEISNRFTALKHLDTKVDINTAWETIKNIKTSTKRSIVYYKLKKHSFTKGCLKLLDHREQAKLQGLQNPSEIVVNGDNMNTIRHEASTHFRNKMRE